MLLSFHLYGITQKKYSYRNFCFLVTEVEGTDNYKGITQSRYAGMVMCFVSSEVAAMNIKSLYLL